MNSKTKTSSPAFIGRINSDIFRILSVALRDKVSDPKLCNVHVLKVDTAPDLGHAKVFVNSCEKELNDMHGFFRNEIAHNIKIRRVPNLRFIIDDGDKNSARVEELLKQINSTKGES